MHTPYKRYEPKKLFEGISFLLLLFVAMPLKYFAGYPLAVTVAGGLHGLLFLAYLWFIIACLLEKSISFRQAISAFLLGFLPTGTFFLKRILGK